MVECTELERLEVPAVIKAGEEVVIRLLRPSDAEVFGNYLTSLSEETKKRFEPHPLTKEAAAEICSSLNYNELLRFAAFTKDEKRMIGYVLLRVGLNDFDVRRYGKRGMELHEESDCTIAPCMADDYQSKGLGNEMMKVVIDTARNIGRKRIVLWAGNQASNERAVNFYTKFGFQKHWVFEWHGGNYDMTLELQ